MSEEVRIEPYRWVCKGYLVTLRDGHECVLRNDRAYAERYAALNHAVVEPMYVKRDEEAK